MVLVKLDESITENHTGIVTSDTLIQFDLLNYAHISIFYESTHIASNPDVSVNKKFMSFEHKKNDYVIQLSVRNNFPVFDVNLMDSESDDVKENFKHDLLHGVIYVSPSAFFNILKRSVDLYMQFRSTKINVSITLLSELNSSVNHNYATYVDLSLISCPFGNIEVKDLDNILKDYFKEPKLMCSSEIFNIPMNQLNIYTPCSLWFSVKSCCRSEEITEVSTTNSLFVRTDYSKLLLSNPSNTYVPQCACVYQNDRKLLSLFRNENYRKTYGEEKTQIHNLINILKRNLMKSKDTTVLLHGDLGVGKGLLVQSVCDENCVHFHEVNCYDLVGESLTATEKRIKKLFETFISFGPCVLYLKHIELLCKDKEGIHEERKIMHYFSKQVRELPNNLPLLVIGSCNLVNDLTTRFQSEFLYNFKLDTPNECDRASLIRAITSDMGYFIHDDIISELSKKTSGFVLSDLIGLFTKISYSNDVNSFNDISFHSQKMCDITEDIANEMTEKLRLMKTNGSNDVLIPKVKWEDVGGLQYAKKDILDTIELPLKLPKLFSTDLQRSGLLFFGPPGCGKTLLAKAIATEFALNFYSVKGPELINMYVGQSEENVRNVFSKARSMAPCIIFFDELDSIAPNRGHSGDSGGVMDRIVSQLLSELDGVHDNTNIFVIGATNRPDLLDPALLRPGRFDKVIYIGVPEDKEERLRIIKAVTRKLNFSEDVDLNLLVDMCPLNLTGADFSALSSECLMNCYRRLIHRHEVDSTELDPNSVIISADDIQLAFKTLIPSVSVSELERYKSIREQYLTQ